MLERISARPARPVLTLLLAIGALVCTTAAANGATIYSNAPKPRPNDLVSQAFEATSTSEFGGQVEFAGNQRGEATIQIGLSSYACENGTSVTCSTARGATFSWPVTVKVYEVGPGNSVGSLRASSTQTLSIPYRPSASKKCPTTVEGKGWGRECSLGKLAMFKYPLYGVWMPSDAIITIAFNTEDYGAHPTHTPGPYDSLNVALASSYTYSEATKEWTFTPEPLLTGTDPVPADAYLSSTWGGAYCDGGAGGTGSLRLDSGCWTGLQPVFNVSAMVA